MAGRYRVTKKFIKWKGNLYYAGNLLPESFTERDRRHHINSNWIAFEENAAEEASATPTKKPTPAKDKAEEKATAVAAASTTKANPATEK